MDRKKFERNSSTKTLSNMLNENSISNEEKLESLKATSDYLKKMAEIQGFNESEFANMPVASPEGYENITSENAHVLHDPFAGKSK